MLHAFGISEGKELFKIPRDVERSICPVKKSSYLFHNTKCYYKYANIWNVTSPPLSLLVIDHSYRMYFRILSSMIHMKWNHFYGKTRTQPALFIRSKCRTNRSFYFILANSFMFFFCSQILLKYKSVSANALFDFCNIAKCSLNIVIKYYIVCVSHNFWCFWLNDPFQQNKWT